MSLRQAADGLMGTHVTWEDVQKDCFEVFGEKAVLGPNKSYVNVSDEKGFVSKICAIDPDWQVVDESLPKKFVLKIVSLLTQEKYSKELNESGSKDLLNKNEQEVIFKRVHNVEVSVYKKLNALKEKCPVLKVCKAVPFSEENETKGYLMMEYVDAIQSMHIDAILSEELIDEILKAIAEIHSLTNIFSEEEKEKMKMNLMSDLFKAMLDAKFVNGIQTAIKAFLPDVNSDSLELLRQYALEMSQKDYLAYMDRAAQDFGYDILLCHGDPWICNMLFVERNGVTHLKALIDLQIFHFGCIGSDMGRLLASILTPDQLSNHKIYLQIYYNHLRKLWPTENIPFTLEQLEKSFLRFLPACAYIHCASISAIGGNVVKKRPVAEQDKAMRMFKEKAENFVHCVIRQHEINREEFMKSKDRNPL